MNHSILIPRIETITERKLVGLCQTMSFAKFELAQLWQAFMPLRKSIENPVNSDAISLAIYQPEHFGHFDPNRSFEKWASVEVSDWENIPEGLEILWLPGGKYAVFQYKGSSTDTSIYQYIFGSWLPQSDFELDQRPHFEVLGSKYRNNDPESEEEIWIPIREKTK